jgi:transcriptional regulator with XRE-family HTH domain
LRDHLGVAVITEELAGCLRSWRERVSPADVGLPAGGQRRVSGLRREEVAQLAGVSMDYLTRLEQGRAANPSAAVLGSLARALRLSEDERAHLFRLAGQPLPGPGVIDTHIPASVQRLMDRLADVPVLVVTVAGEILAANALASALQGDLTDLSRRERTLAWRNFSADRRSRIVHSSDGQADAEEIAVADLQHALARYPHDTHLTTMIAELRTRNPRFQELWSEHRVRRAHARRKTFDHPALGELTFDCDALAIEGTALQLIVYTAAPGSPAAEALPLLAAIGLQEFSTKVDPSD